MRPKLQLPHMHHKQPLRDWRASWFLVIPLQIACSAVFLSPKLTPRRGFPLSEVVCFSLAVGGAAWAGARGLRHGLMVYGALYGLVISFLSFDTSRLSAYRSDRDEVIQISLIAIGMAFFCRACAFFGAALGHLSDAAPQDPSHCSGCGYALRGLEERR